MASVVAIHGINNTYIGPNIMADTWVPPLLDGVELAGGRGLLEASDVSCVFYGDVYRGPGRHTLGNDDVPWLEPSDVDNGYEQDLLFQWWAGAAEVDPGVIPPEARSLGVSTGVQAALAALANSRFLANVSEHLLIFWLKQVHLYFTAPHIRSAIQARLAEAVDRDTRVVVAHSLGSVVAYEALCANPQWPVTTLVTLGSPLGIRNLVFDRVTPQPQRNPDTGAWQGLWPQGLTSWTNINDRGDFVALVKVLRLYFGDRLTDIPIDNGMSAHQVSRYLTSVETGTAVVEGLRNA